MKISRRNFLRSGVSTFTQGGGGMSGLTSTLTASKTTDAFLSSMQGVFFLQGSVKQISHGVLCGIFSEGHKGMPDMTGATKDELAAKGFTKEALHAKYSELANSLSRLQTEHSDRVSQVFNLLEPFSRSHLFDVTFRSAKNTQERMVVIQGLLAEDQGVSSGLFLDLQVADQHYPSTFLANWLSTVDGSTFDLFAATYKEMSQDFICFRGFMDDFFYIENLRGGASSYMEIVRRWSTIFELSDDEGKMAILRELAGILPHATNLMNRLVQAGTNSPFVQLIQETATKLTEYESSLVGIEGWEKIVESGKFWETEKISILQRFGQLQGITKAIQEGIEKIESIEGHVSQDLELTQSLGGDV